MADPDFQPRDPDERMAERHSRMLHELANVCMGIVRKIDKALTDATPEYSATIWVRGERQS